MINSITFFLFVFRFVNVPLSFATKLSLSMVSFAYSARQQKEIRCKRFAVTCACSILSRFFNRRKNNNFIGCRRILCRIYQRSFDCIFLPAMSFRQLFFGSGDCYCCCRLSNRQKMKCTSKRILMWRWDASTLIRFFSLSFFLFFFKNRMKKKMVGSSCDNGETTAATVENKTKRLNECKTKSEHEKKNLRVESFVRQMKICVCAFEE